MMRMSLTLPNFQNPLLKLPTWLGLALPKACCGWAPGRTDPRTV